MAKPVPDATVPAVASLVTDLTDTVAHWRETTSYGRAIAVPQIGELHRVVDGKSLCSREEFERQHRADSPYAQK